MAWPSSTKAGTTNVDNGSDKPSLARPDIKQNIDNVNAIIDTFNIASPNDGDLLQYSSSSGQWEQVASSAITPTGFTKEASITINNNNVFTSGTETIFADYTENSDNGNILSYPDSTGTSILEAGKYRFLIQGRFTGGGSGNTPWTLSMFGKTYTINDDTVSTYIDFVDLTTGNESDITLTGNNQSEAQAIIFDIEVFFTKL